MPRRAVCLAVLVLAAGLAPAASAEVRQRDYEAADDDLSIFGAIVVEAVEHGTRLAAATAGGRTGDVQDAADELSTLSGGFSEDVVEFIATYGTAPPALETLRDDVAAFNDAAQRVAATDSTLRAALERLRADAVGPEASKAVGTALSTLSEELGAVADLQVAAAALGQRGTDVAPLRAALAATEDALDTLRLDLEQQLALLKLPAVLTLNADRRVVPLDGSVTFDGLALREGEPASGDVVTVRFVGTTRTATVDRDGRYAVTISVPLSVTPGRHDASADARIGGEDLAAGPVAITVDPIAARLTLDVATTALSDRNDLGWSGQLAAGPFPVDGRRVVLLFDGREIASARAGPDGSFAATAPVGDVPGGHHSIRARYLSPDGRLSSATSAPIRIFVPYLPEETRPVQPLGPLVEFLFPTTGLGIILDLLAVVILLGLFILAYHAVFTGEARLAFRAWKRLTAFRRLVRFKRASAKDKAKADPRRAFPPDEALPPGPLFAAFVDAVRRFRPVPRGITHRELARALADAGVEQRLARDATQLYEASQYRPEGARADARRLRGLLEGAWGQFVRSADAGR